MLIQILAHTCAADELLEIQNKQTHTTRFVLPEHIHLMIPVCPMDDNAMQRNAIAVVRDVAVIV